MPKILKNVFGIFSNNNFNFAIFEDFSIDPYSIFDLTNAQ